MAESQIPIADIDIDALAVPGGPGATGGLRRLNAFFLLLDRPEVYGLPAAPSRGAERIAPGLASGLLAMAGFALAALVALRKR